MREAMPQSMITVTPAASASLAELLDGGNVPPHLVLRVVCDGQRRLDVSLESPQLEDTLFNHRGRNVLSIEPQAARLLSGSCLDLPSE